MLFSAWWVFQWRFHQIHFNCPETWSFLSSVLSVFEKLYKWEWYILLPNLKVKKISVGISRITNSKQVRVKGSAFRKRKEKQKLNWNIFQNQFIMLPLLLHLKSRSFLWVRSVLHPVQKFAKSFISEYFPGIRQFCLSSSLIFLFHPEKSAIPVTWCRHKLYTTEWPDKSALFCRVLMQW